MKDLLAFYFSATLYHVSPRSYTKVVVSISTTPYCSSTHVCILFKKRETIVSVCCFTFFFCYLSFLTLSFIQLITAKVKHKDKS